MTIHTRGGKDFELSPPDGLLDQDVFRDTIVEAYNRGVAETELPADDGVARSLIPAGTGLYRDFSYIAPDIPEYDAEKCVGCMECVTECPDTAILGKVVEPAVLDAKLDSQPDSESLRSDFAKTKKYWDAYEKKGKPGGLFGIHVDPTKC